MGDKGEKEIQYDILRREWIKSGAYLTQSFDEWLVEKGWR